MTSKKVWIKLSRDDTVDLMILLNATIPITHSAKQRRERILHELKDALKEFK